MCTYIRQLNIILVIALIVFNVMLLVFGVTTIGILGKILSESNHNDSLLNFAFLIIASIKGLAALIIIYYFGKRVIYFKMLSYLKVYVINLISCLFISALLIVFKIAVTEEEDIKSNQHYENFRNIIMIISIILVFTYSLSLICLFRYKRRLEDQVSESPLNKMSDPDSISSELYQNIIDQSKDPDNPKLKAEYRRLSQKKLKINSDSVF